MLVHISNHSKKTELEASLFLSQINNFLDAFSVMMVNVNVRNKAVIGVVKFWKKIYT